MIKYRNLLILSLTFFLNGCFDTNSPSIDDLKGIGYKHINCSYIDYFDSKSDLAEDPFFKIYSPVQANDPELSILAARCFNKTNCIYEIIENNEVVCQKYIVASNTELLKTWEDHEVLVFNTKNNFVN